MVACDFWTIYAVLLADLVTALLLMIFGVFLIRGERFNPSCRARDHQDSVKRRPRVVVFAAGVNLEALF